jgi:uncharacterized membrane protein YgaE (UPF0421/DUF939 family)
VDHPVGTRLRRALPDVEISASWDVVRRRARAWTWPAVQMGVAAALSWWIAHQVARDAASYAPITAIVGLGLGRERRLGRSAILATGLFLGVIAAELATIVIGAGWWQVGLCMTLTAVVAGALIGHDLAVTYAAINTVVLLTTPGGHGWFPSRLVAGLVGVLVALTVLLLIAPARPAHLVRRRLGRAAERAGAAMDATADALGPDRPDGEPTGDERPLVSLARRLDDEIEQSHETVDQAGELVRWSPWRRSRADEVEQLGRIAHELRPALRTASTIARLADRAVGLGVSAPEQIREAIHDAGRTLEALTDDLLDDSPPDRGEIEAASGAVDRLMTSEVEHAVLVAMKEEVRGLLADLDGIVESVFDAAPPAPGTLRSATVGNIVYGDR